MIDRQTPETDAATFDHPLGFKIVRAEDARRLERERDELREALVDDIDAGDDVAECVELDREQRAFAAGRQDYLRAALARKQTC